METLRQLAALDHDSADIFDARTYIANAQVPSVGFTNLAVGRETVLTGAFAGPVDPFQRQGLERYRARRCGAQTRYTQAYRENHRQFHHALTEFQVTLMTAKKKRRHWDC